jgi:hypothetical protein
MISGKIANHESNFGPSLATNIQTYVAWTDSDNKIFIAGVEINDNSISVPEPIYLNIMSPFAPSLASYKDYLYIAWTDMDQKSLHFAKLITPWFTDNIDLEQQISVVPRGMMEIMGSPSLFTDYTGFDQNGDPILIQRVTWTDINYYLNLSPNPPGDYSVLYNTPQSRNTPANCEGNYISWTDFVYGGLMLGKIAPPIGLQNLNHLYEVQQIYSFSFASSASPALLPVTNISPGQMESIEICFRGHGTDTNLYLTYYPQAPHIQPINLGVSSKSAPSLCSFQDKVILGWTDLNGEINIGTGLLQF